MSSNHRENNCEDLLEFLMSASHQIKVLLDVQNYQQQQQQLGFKAEEQRFYLDSRTMASNVSAYSNGFRLAHQNSPEFVPNDPMLEHQQQQQVYISNSNSTNTTSSSNYATHHYVPSTSTNFVDLRQYSAKSPQRQDTGLAWREVTPFIPTTSSNTTTTATTNAAAIFVMPPPPLQEYQPECAYCCWLANGFVDQ